MERAEMADKRSILVVDDDSAFLAVVKSILQVKGYAVETASSAREAIAKAREQFFNVAVVDIGLPDKEGTEALSSLLEIDKDLIVIMLTGYSSVQNAIQSLNRGAFAYLEKPLDPDHLLSVAVRGLERQRLVLENRRLMAELERRNRETGILLSVSQAVSQSLEMEEIIEAALDKVEDTFGVQAGHVHLLEENRLVFRGCRGFASEAGEGTSVTKIEESIIGRIVESGEPAVVQDLACRTDIDYVLDCLAGSGFRSYAGIPLTIMGENIGAMGVATSSVHCFTSEEVNLLNGVAREIAIAIRNAQLYEEASSNRALRELDALRTDFLANVSHELRTPLAAIKGFASTLLQPDVSFDELSWRDFLYTIDKEADRLNRLIEELLVMSCLEAGALQVRRGCNDMADVIESIRDRLYSLASGHDLRICVPTDLPQIVVDEGHIGEVITNLVENAVKYSQEGSQITIDVQPGEDQLVTSVYDHGIGVPQEFHERIFNRFCQLKNDTVGYRPGTGLGLSICQGIVEAHGGRIWVESIPGEGARFVFTIPTSLEE